MWPEVLSEKLLLGRQHQYTHSVQSCHNPAVGKREAVSLKRGEAKTTCACVLTPVSINMGLNCLKCCHLKCHSLTFYCVKVSSSLPGCCCSSGDCRRRCLLCVVPQDGHANRTSREGITSATWNMWTQ